MLFSKDDLREKMIEGVHPFELVWTDDEPSGHRSQRMTIYTFRHEGNLYQFDLTYDEMEGQHWCDVGDPEECPEVEAHTTTTVVYKVKS